MPRLTNKQQITRIKQIIRKDANLTGSLVSEGKMCAVGGLAHYGVGVPLAKLRMMDTREAFVLVKRQFPVLKGMHAYEVSNINDAYKDTLKRRNTLCAFFDKVIA